MSDELEIGHDLDKAFRAIMMFGGQMVERSARRRAEEDRNRAAQVREQAQAAREQASYARRAWVDERDAARTAYRPFLNPTALQKATPEQAARAWVVANHWAQQDPTAREAERVLAEGISREHKATPQEILTRPVQDEPTVNLDKEPVAATSERQSPAGQPLNADEQRLTEWAIERAEATAPSYYTRHDPTRLLGADGQYEPAAARQLIDDMQSLTHGYRGAQAPQLPADSVLQEWGRHVGRPDLTVPAGEQLGERAREELQSLWEGPAAQPLTVEQARQLGQQVAPAYYHRHELDWPETGALLSDMEEARRTGEIPFDSRMDAWAAHTGAEDLDPNAWPGGAADPDRHAALQQHWEATAEDRDLLELERHTEAMEEAGMDPAALDVSGAADPQSVDVARRTYESLLDPEIFNTASAAEAAAAWQAATTLADPQPQDRIAADQLGLQFRSRFKQDPAAYLQDAASDRSLAATEQLAANADRERAQETGQQVDPATGQVPEQTPAQAARLESAANAHQAVADDSRATAASPEPAYDRAEESDLESVAVNGTAEGAIEARVDSSHGFSQPTAQMVAKTAAKPARTRTPQKPPRRPQQKQGAGTEQGR